MEGHAVHQKSAKSDNHYAKLHIQTFQHMKHSHANTIIILKLHLSVRESVRDGTWPTFTGNQFDPEAFSPSQSSLEAIIVLLWKATAYGSHDGKLRTCMEGE